MIDIGGGTLVTIDETGAVAIDGEGGHAAGRGGEAVGGGVLKKWESWSGRGGGVGV